LPRRSPAEIEAVVERIAALLSERRQGLRAEQIREELRLSAAELPRPLSEGLATGRFVKAGQKRATTYSLPTPRALGAKATKAAGARAAASSPASPPPAPNPGSAGQMDMWEGEAKPETAPDPQ
jgi:hypothetical protein